MKSAIHLVSTCQALLHKSILGAAALKDGSCSFTTVLGLDSMECLDFDLMIAQAFGIDDEGLLTNLYCSKREEKSASFHEPREQDPLIPLEPMVERIYGLLALQGRIAP